MHKPKVRFQHRPKHNKPGMRARTQVRKAAGMKPAFKASTAVKKATRG